MLPEIDISEYDYELPPGRIAQFPLRERDGSKLLVFNGDGIAGDIFRNIGNYLPGGSMLLFNDTRVIRARLLFRKSTGAQIEIFCLEPLEPAEMETAFHARGTSTWKCLVGNSKRWKEGELELYAPGTGIRFTATRVRGLEEGTFEIRFSWTPNELSFSEALEQSGKIPLPPYIHRDNVPDDNTRYQTVYAHYDGSVAAPTAGLHFTRPLLDSLAAKGVLSRYVTLHVGAGTFRPVSPEGIGRHVMHRERISVTLDTIRALGDHLPGTIIPVGTTAARTAETLYWLGVKLAVDGQAIHPEVLQWDPYLDKYQAGMTTKESLDMLAGYLEKQGMEAYHGETQLLIAPGYVFRLASALITNFHMPRSTLLLLVAALTGERWKEAYRYALDNGFRFLSYGDACLFFPPR